MIPEITHYDLLIVLSITASIHILGAVYIIWMVRDTSKSLARLIIQETNKIPGKLTERE
jgi:hypothetical protein